MTPLTLTQEIRFRTGSDVNTFTDADVLRLINKHKDLLSLDAIKANEDLFGTIQTRDLVASTSSREYSLPTGLVKIKAVEAKLDGTNWVRLVEFDLDSYQHTTDEDTIQDNFSNEEGYASFEIYRNSLFIYSGVITAGTDALKLYCIVRPADLTDLTLTTDLSADPTTTSFGIPTEFHNLLARYVSRDYKQAGDKSMQLADDEQDMILEKDRAKMIDALMGLNLSRTTQLKVPTYLSGYE